MTSRQPPTASDAPCFDMWRDYMNLGGLLKKIRSGGLMEAEGPCQPPEGPQCCGDSVESNSVSSRSDTSLTGGPSEFCPFCKRNGETPDVYRSHKLKADDGKVVCPVLWKYTCPVCDATGDHAHTRRYCQLARRLEVTRTMQGPKFW
ncbi:nanos homolog 2-like [Dunckerocampus dactyliophorus]|uniref:nanos homolog 2-like n=1 Tax=Dunckerocampus dactyliophorus TaxID=161453 RepID=UPI0024066DC4|nr:nanos homolog 2-like [Dunckerocampus dactyliophorus]